MNSQVKAGLNQKNRSAEEIAQWGIDFFPVRCGLDGKMDNGHYDTKR
jgi:hypothetical protein